MYHYYQEYLGKVEEETGEERNFSGCAFACATVNLGPEVRTFVHRDMLNLAFGWCGIMPLGKFDHTKGGHVILWEAKLVVEVPAGYTIFIPSATITHSNTPIGAHESRASFTMYTGGGIFRCVDNGFKTDESLKKSDPKKFAETLEERKTRWKAGLGLFSTLKELVADL